MRFCLTQMLHTKKTFFIACLFLSFPPLMSHFSWAFSFATFCGTSPVGWLIRLVTCTNCSMMLRCLKDVQWAAFHGIVAASSRSIRTPLRIDGALPHPWWCSAHLRWRTQNGTQNCERELPWRTWSDVMMHGCTHELPRAFGHLGCSYSSHHLIWQSERGGYCTCTSSDVHHHVLYNNFISGPILWIYLTVQIEECRMQIE